MTWGITDYNKMPSGKATSTKRTAVGPGALKAKGQVGPASHNLRLEDVAKHGPMTQSGRERTHGKHDGVRGAQGKSYTYYPYVPPPADDLGYH